MRVDVDEPGHDHAAGGVDGPGRLGTRVARPDMDEGPVREGDVRVGAVDVTAAVRIPGDDPPGSLDQGDGGGGVRSFVVHR